jgi:hypothetical protein
MTAEPNLSAPPSQPAPRRTGKDVPIPSRIGQVLTLVRWLFDYGKVLLATLQQPPPAPDFVILAAPFGTLDPAVITARILCALRRIIALEARLQQHAATGRDLVVASLYQRAARKRTPCEAQEPVEETPEGLPTMEQIEAEVRRKPIGRIIADICRDLGITPGVLSRATLNEVIAAIAGYGGSYARYCRDMMKRALDPAALRRASASVEQWVAGDAPTPALAATGPPTAPP